VLGLPLDLQRRGHDVTVILPKYRSIPRKGRLRETFAIPIDGSEIKISLWQTRVYGIDVWLLEDHTPRRWLSRVNIYGYSEDPERFALFARAAAAVVEQRRADIVHLHDWHSAPVAFFGKNSGLRFVLTLHNPQYQGHINRASFKKFGTSVPKEAIEGRAINLLKLGILSADFITTVSPTFAKETIKGTVEWGVGKLLGKKPHRFTGILNGIDYAVWNPATDPYIKAHLNLSKMVKTANRLFKSIFSYKKTNKSDLQRALKLEVSDKPIIACITRLVEQKGLDLIHHAIEHTKKRGGQFVLLGSGSSEETQKTFRELEKKLDSPLDIHMQFKHDERIAHKIFAGSDMFVIPSIFEPCGLTQMIAMRFGTIPIARKTGGLADTVHDVDYHRAKRSTANGFLFEKPTKASIERAINRALETWEQRPTDWQRLVSDALTCRFDWKESGQKYLDLYEELLTRA
jgi:starch synthase